MGRFYPIPCDDEVLLQGIVPVEYATALFEIAQLVQTNRRVGQTIAMVRCPNVEVRVRSILASATIRRKLGWRVFLGLAVATGLVSLMTAVLRPSFAGPLRSIRMGFSKGAASFQERPFDLGNRSATLEFANGLTVNLASFSHTLPPYRPSEAWNAFGVPLGRVPFSSYRAIPARGKRTMNMGFVLAAERDQDVSMFGFVLDLAKPLGSTRDQQGWSSYRRVALKGRQSVAEICSVDWPEEAERQGLWYELAVASGAWEPILDRLATDSERGGDEIEFRAGPDGIQLIQSGWTDVLIDPCDLMRFDYQLVGITDSGKRIPMSVKPDQMIRGTVRSVPGDPIRRIRVMKRPWTWSHQPIVSRPNQESQLEPTPEDYVTAERGEALIAPGLRVRLKAIGTDFSTRLTTHWNPDGSLLKFEQSATSFGRNRFMANQIGYYLRTLAIEFDSDRPQEISYLGFVPGVAQRGHFAGNGWEEGQSWKVLPAGISRDLTGEFSFGFPLVHEFFLGINFGSDNTFEAIPLTLDLSKAKGGIRLSTSPYCMIETLDDHRAVVDRQRINFNPGDWHFVVRDLEGHVLKTSSSNSSVWEVSSSDVPRVKTIGLSRQRTRWVRFPNLHLEVPQILKDKYVGGVVTGSMRRVR